MISIGEVGYEVHVHSNRNYKEFVRLDVECEEQIVKIVGGGPVTIHSSGQTTFSCTHIEGITLGAGEEVDEVAGGADGMGVDEKFLSKRPPASRLASNFLVSLTHFILTHNYFSFNSLYYLQVKGTAKGTRMAPLLS